MLKNLFKKYRTLILVAILIIIALFSYPILFGGDGDTPVLSSQTLSEQRAAVGGELLSTLLKLKSLQLNDSIFTDPAFERLEDFGTPLSPEPVGRRNPFAPLGSDAGAPAAVAQ